MADGDIDEDTIKLMMSLQLEDVTLLEGKQKGKHHEGEFPDADIALALYKENLKDMLASTEDRTLSKSMSLAVIADAKILRTLASEEEAARRDRAMAESLQNGRPRTAPKAPEENDLDESLLEKLAYFNVSNNLASGIPDGLPDAESSSWAASRLGQQSKRECLACCDQFAPSDLAHCPCKHDYCRDCLVEVFETAMRDEAFFPPRCCQTTISLDDHRNLFTDEFAGGFKAKELELSTPNRIYCHEPACSAFIPPAFIHGNVATCIKCKALTCTLCKTQAHEEEDCPSDPATQQLLQTARALGWQQCPQCRRLVELSHGCYHMTCLCKHEFCYLCAKTWKTCNCVHWAERRLFDRANDIVNRDPNARRMDPRERAQRVAHERERLRENHDCDRHYWVYRTGRHRCESCEDTLPQFIFECRTCRIMACRRCRDNRF